MPSGSLKPPAAGSLILPAEGRDPGEVFLVLPGLNLHPARLDGWKTLLNAEGHTVAVPELSGYGSPGDPALDGVAAESWLDDVSEAWRSVSGRLPDARPSLLGYSLGGLLGLVWALERGIPLHGRGEERSRSGQPALHRD